jgi:hypothetical protein
MKALLIDATAQNIREVEYQSLTDMQRLIGGFIEVAYTWDDGDTLYVDEEGMLKGADRGFLITVRPDQPLMGNGLLVGEETGEGLETNPPTMTVEELRQRVAFFTGHGPMIR